MSNPTDLSPRREFLGQLTAGALGLTGVGIGATDALALPSSQGVDTADAWVNKLKGKHRQYFDAITVDGGFSLGYAMNWLDTMKSTYKVSDSDLSAVVGWRHFSIPLAYKDEVWAKYKLGEFAKITDPVTKQPATRNIFYNSKAGDIIFPGMAIEKLQARGVTFVVCNVAHTVLSGMMGKGQGMTAEAAAAEWAAGLLPGMILVPSGVLAVNVAQQKGKCTYCNAA